ncbi:hypothetical protein FRX31_013417 [Thalictrum thalictroides]|uniref:Uncharacterized protein n=1 Tax=Thalictrum thalictroides TaxID=46969 RepID=A0A7J6WKL0_THATH|nr:hypothetical protein FRX31_013417 [Thalictrum thalictroides]
MGWLSCCGKRWSRELYILFSLFKTQVTENPSLSFMRNVCVGHGSSLPIRTANMVPSSTTVHPGIQPSQYKLQQKSHKSFCSFSSSLSWINKRNLVVMELLLG